MEHHIIGKVSSAVTGLLALLLCAAAAVAAEDGPVGRRPYEMVWAGRTEDDHPPLVDFEDVAGWQVECTDAEARFERTREQQLWDRYVGRLTYRGHGPKPVVRILKPKPVPIREAFDAVTCWVYGNNWAWHPDPATPQVRVEVLLADAAGADFAVPLAHVNWKEWFLCHRRLTPDRIARVAKGGAFKGFIVRGGTNADDRVLYFDNLAVFVEPMPPLEFEPRPKRGIALLPDADPGTNTGPGRLPFPTRPETILPDSAAKDFQTALAADGDAFVFTYTGPDGRLAWRLQPRTGTLGDVTVRWDGRGGEIRPCVGGGVYLAGDAGAVAPEKAEPLSTVRNGDAVQSRWHLAAGNRAVDVTYTWRLWGKSLVIDVVAPAGNVAEVRWGRARGLQEPRLVTLPYYTCGGSRPAVAVSGLPSQPLFLAEHIDWYLSNASEPWAANAVGEDGVALNGGTRYIPTTDGRRNACCERLFLTLSPRFEEVLPCIPNPTSPSKHVTGTHLWRAHGASNRERDLAFWTNCRRHGMTEVVVTDHETMWRDGGESFTFRTRAAPGRGGDESQRRYSRAMQDDLGFVYGPYNNFTDFAPVNAFWSADRVTRTADNQLQRAWARCYAPKPARAVEFCARLAPQIQEKFHFSTAYCDVHTAVAPWHRVDYDPRVPGAGSFAAVFYPFGEIMLLQKAAWKGPVYSEGGYHFMYAGLTDGNYAQDQPYRIAENPWLVDFDLRKMHPLCCNFGMGNPRMFFGKGGLGPTPQERDASLDRFLAATVAFGHPGFLVYEGGTANALRSYYLIQQLAARYTQADVAFIGYVDADGRVLETSEAVASGVYKRSQVVVRYADGTTVAANGHPTERMRFAWEGSGYDLPPNGFAGTAGPTPHGPVIDVVSADRDGHRFDVARTPAYLYIDGRGRFVRRAGMASDGIGICRVLGDGAFEVIPFQGAECGFAVRATKATALDAAGKGIGQADLRTARGLTYVMPVNGAFSYRVEGELGQAPAPLACPRDEVVAGETVVVSGKVDHEVRIPADARPCDRLWRHLEDAWIDFTVVEPFRAELSLDGQTLNVELVSRLPKAEDVTVTATGRSQTVRAAPGKPARVALDLGPPEREAVEPLNVEMRAGDVVRRLQRRLRTARETPPLAPWPDTWQAGMCLRGKTETRDFGRTRGYVHAGSATCGGVAKTGLRMHPPYVGGTGYAFALIGPIALPAEPAAAFRASVGKADGGDVGDGILYKVVVVEKDGRETVATEQHVAQFTWRPVEADLSRWVGRTVRLKLIADVGPADNSSADWAAWAEMRVETLAPRLVRTLEAAPGDLPREP